MIRTEEIPVLLKIALAWLKIAIRHPDDSAAVAGAVVALEMIEAAEPSKGTP